MEDLFNTSKKIHEEVEVNSILLYFARDVFRPCCMVSSGVCGNKSLGFLFILVSENLLFDCKVK